MATVRTAVVVAAALGLWIGSENRAEAQTCKILESTRQIVPGGFGGAINNQARYNAKVEYDPGAGRSVKSISIVLYENTGVVNGVQTKGKEKGRQKYTVASGAVVATGGTSWYAITNGDTNAVYLVSAEMELDNNAVVPSQLSGPTAVNQP